MFWPPFVRSSPAKKRTSKMSKNIHAAISRSMSLHVNKVRGLCPTNLEYACILNVRMHMFVAVFCVCMHRCAQCFTVYGSVLRYVAIVYVVRFPPCLEDLVYVCCNVL